MIRKAIFQTRVRTTVLDFPGIGFLTVVLFRSSIFEFRILNFSVLARCQIFGADPTSLILFLGPDEIGNADADAVENSERDHQEQLGN
jgi:hypothetical protein